MDPAKEICTDLVNTFSSVFDDEQYQPFCIFWKTIFRTMDDKGFFRRDEDTKRVRGLMQGSATFLHEVKESDIESLEAVERLRLHLIETGLIHLDHRSCELLGDLADPETPLGFYRLMSPFPQTETEFSLFSQCLTNMMERVLYGPTLCWLSTKLIYFKRIKKNEDEQMRIVAEKMHRMFLRKLSVTQRIEFFREIHNLVTRLKEFSCFFPIMNSQIFYEEGIRFYEQNKDRFYVSSTSSGLLIPEEFYGSDFYEPGITKTFPPSLFTVENLLCCDQNEKVREWDEHLQVCARKVWKKENREIKNPFRNLYFINGITRNKWKPICYQYEVKGVAQALQNAYRRYSEIGKGGLYLEDVKSLFRFFYDHVHIRIYENPNFREESSWLTLSSGVDGDCLLSVRGDKRAIAHGFKLNLKKIKKLGLATELGAIIQGLSHHENGEIVGTIAISVHLLVQRIVEKFKNVENEFTESRLIEKHENSSKGERFIENKIKSMIGI